MKIIYTDQGKVADDISVEGSNTLKNGDWIFAYNTDSDFDINLESLESANGMFYGCNLNSQGIENIAFNLKSTNDGVMDVGFDTTDTNVENALTKITSKGWNVLPNRHLNETSTTGKFELCETVDEVKNVDANYITTDIKDGIWNEPLPILTNGERMFYNTALETFNPDLSSLTTAASMFHGCTALTSFDSNLSSLTDGRAMFWKCFSLTSFNTDLSSLKYGGSMFGNCSNLTSFDSDLSSLTEGSYMFGNCHELTTFTSDLPNLTNGKQMFMHCHYLTSFNSDLSNLTNGNYMFYSCIALTTFDSDLSNLTDGNQMFDRCTALTTFDSDLSSLTNGEGMFSGCKLDLSSFMRIGDTLPVTSGNPTITIGLADTHNGVAINITDEYVETVKKIYNKGWSLEVTPSPLFTYKYQDCETVDEVKNVDANYITTDIKDGIWNEPLPSLTDGERMFYYCTALTTFYSNLSSLTDGSSMFNACSNLTTFYSNLSNLTDGSDMFMGCNALTTFNGDLSSLTNVEGMFDGCIGLATFNGDLSSLTNGYQMFYNCTALTTFNSNLHNLTSGNYMFDGCTALTSFNGDLSSLTNGEGMFHFCSALTSFNGDLSSLTEGTTMFRDCNLDEESVIRIAETINDVSDSTEKYLSLGINPIIVEKDSIRAAISKIRIKGWRVNVHSGNSVTTYPSIKNYPIITNDNFVGFRDTYPNLVQSLYYIEDGYMYDQNKDFLGVFESSGLEKSVEGGSLTENFYNSNLRTVNTDFDNLVDGNHMFTISRELKSFKGNLSKLLIGYQMFAGCSSLTSFEGDLSSLECGYHLFCGGEDDFSGVDQYTKLDKKSIKNIANSIQSTSQFPDSTEEEWDELGGFFDYRGHLSLGVDPEILNDYEVNQYFKQIINKGWTLYVNGDTQITEDTINANLNNFGVKYQDCETDGEVENVDANYITTDIKDGLWNEPLPSLINGIGMFYQCTALTSFNSDLSSLIDGQHMFYYCTNLTTFNGDLSSLTDGGHMFMHCNELTTFTSDLSNLTDGSWMFSWCTNLTSFNGDLSSLTSGSTMFNVCKSLESFNCDLSSLIDGRHMFSGCTNLTSFDSDLSSLINGNCMFQNCKKLTSFYSDLPSLTNGHNMFYNCSALTSFTSDLSNLYLGTDMFSGCTNLTSFTSDLSSLTDGSYMFSNCKLNTASVQNIASTINTVSSGRIDLGINSSIVDDADVVNSITTIAKRGWNVYVNGKLFELLTTYVEFNSDGDVVSYDLSGIKDGSYLFAYTTLESFNGDLTSLTRGNYMFYNCTALTTFDSDLLSLTDGNQMFRDCTALTTFDAGLSKLTHGYYMFQSCKLDTASVQKIASTINDLSDDTDDGSAYWSQIHIGIQASLRGTTEIDSAISTIQSKGWTVTAQYNA